MSRNITMAVVAICAFYSVINCSCNSKKNVHRTIICFIDFSETPKWEERISDYTDVVNNSIIKNMGYNDKLIILPIDKQTTQNSTPIIVESLKKQLDYIPDGTSPLEEDNVAQKNLNVDIKKIGEEFNANMLTAKNARKDFHKGTDIVGALTILNEKYYEAGQENIVIFLSDMMNWSDKLKMEEESFNANSIESSLTNSDLPNLSGKSMKIIVHQGDITNIGNEHFKIVKNFWSKYFDIYKIALVDYDSGGKTKLEEVMRTH